MKKLSFFWLCCLLLLAGGTSVFAQDTPEDDAFLQMLRTELQSQYDSLRHTIHPPYFMAYRVKETTEHSISANFGKIYDNSTAKSVVLTIEIRVGTSETDNYHYLTHQNTFVRQIPLPLDENPAIVRKILRNETRKAHQEAVIQSVENKLAATLQVGEDDYEKFLFLSSDLDGYYSENLNMESHWDDALWEQKLRYCTAFGNLDLTEKSANIRYVATRKYLVNSEKSYDVKNEMRSLLTLRVSGLTMDKTPEHIERQFFAFFPDQLPDDDVLKGEIEKMDILLSNVIHAERCDLSHCPVLLSPKASSVLIHNLLGHDLENADGNYLRERIGQKVLPAEISVYSDPLSTVSYQRYHAGSYFPFDDEGTPVQPVTHISHGELQPKMLSSRTQRPGAYKPYGHARGNSRLPSPRQSNLFLKSDKPLNDSKLFELLNQETQKQSLEYALYVEEVEVRCDTNDVVTICPTVCYKIYPNYRKPDEMVRDVLLTGSKLQWLSNLLAAGEESESVAILCHSQQDDLMTCGSAPALLFRSADVQSQPKTPQQFQMVNFATGEGSNTPMNVAELLQKSAQHEWETDVEHLKIGDETGPYYEEFLMTDARIFTVEASEGSVFYANEKPVRQFVPRLLLGSDAFNNENLTEETTPPASYPLPFEDRYTFTKDFRNACDIEYRKALNHWKIKQALQPTPETRTLPDRSAAQTTQTDDERTFDYPTMNNLEHLACDVSAELAKHDFLSRSGANIYIMMGNAYYWSSEKTTYSRPISVIALQIYGAVKKADGEEYVDGKTLFFPNTDSLLSIQYAKNEIDMLVSHLKSVKTRGIPNEGYWSGPMLVEGEAVGQMLMTALLGAYPNLLTNKKEADFSWITEEKLHEGVHPFEQMLDRIVISKKISVTANVVGDEFDRATFVRHEKTDAEGVETQETEVIRNGELITLLGNRNITKATPYSNGFQQLAIQNESCFGAKGASRIDFDHKTKVQHAKLKQMLIKEAKKQGCQYAYILRQAYDDNMQNIIGRTTPYLPLLQLYRVNVRTGEEIPVTDAALMSSYFNFCMLDDIQAVSNHKVAYPVMTKVKGTTGSRDFPFAGVPTCIVAPDGILLKSVPLHHP